MEEGLRRRRRMDSDRHVGPELGLEEQEPFVGFGCSPAGCSERSVVSYCEIFSVERNYSNTSQSDPRMQTQK